MRLAQLLDPDPVAPPPVVTPAQVGGPAAWQDLVRCGALTLVRDASPGTGGTPVGVAAGTRLTPVHRALALAAFTGGTLPARAVLAGSSAAWAYTGLYEGVVVGLLADGGVPLELAHDAGVHRPDAPASATVRCSPGLVQHTARLGGVPVTTPARTAADVACRLPLEHAVPVLAALAAGDRDTPPVDLGAVERALETRRRVVGRPAARRALAAARARGPG
ncbi:hypothetical protein [Myceligenerans crystallogenes]|uniref:Uncharacterized protein n=1 Tax=Myceligenerans crystallogenes TaxID=316335 RepID=A0ABN2NMZ6_9MICO